METRKSTTIRFADNERTCFGVSSSHDGPREERNKMTANVNAVMRPQVGNVNKIVPCTTLYKESTFLHQSNAMETTSRRHQKASLDICNASSVQCGEVGEFVFFHPVHYI